MKQYLIIRCGETTCASEPGVFCRFLVLGNDPSCFVFSSRLKDKDGNGWVMRCEECLEATTDASEEKEMLKQERMQKEALASTRDLVSKALDIPEKLQLTWQDLINMITDLRLRHTIAKRILESR